MLVLSALLALLGIVSLLYRLRAPRAQPTLVDSEVLQGAQAWPRVSVIIPARNEAHNLPRLLGSLRRSGYPDLEVIVVDDHSTDGTGDCARSFGVDVLSPPSLPEGWWGKNWACYNGYLHAKGDYLLFTDADTEFLPGGIERLVQFQRSQKLSLVCPLPYHLCELAWERWMGPFHCLYLVATAPLDAPRPQRLYANGQCLLFSRNAYQIMGHREVGQRMPEDLTLAREFLHRGLGYGVYPHTDVYAVNMYSSVGEFFAGWRRNMRFGLKQSELLATLEVTGVIVGGLGIGKLWFSPLSALVLVGISLIIYAKQRRFGRFSWLGALLTPFAILMFCALSLVAVIDMLRARPTLWKGRAYSARS